MITTFSPHSPFDKAKRRRSIRLQGYNYSRAGLYYITICTQNRLPLLGKITPVHDHDTNTIGPTMVLNDAGRMVDTVWNEIPNYYHGFAVHDFIVMPDHIHGIIEIIHNMPVGAGPRACPDGPHPHQRPDENHRTPHSESSPSSPRACPNDPDLHQCPDDNHATPNCITGQPCVSTGQLDDGTGQPRGVAPTDGSVDDACGGSGGANGPKMTLPDIVHRFKTMTTKRYTDGVKQHGWPPFPGKLWQRNYYEHIIRDEESYRKIADYIVNNPSNWREDDYCDA